MFVFKTHCFGKKSNRKFWHSFQKEFFDKNEIKTYFLIEFKLFGNLMIKSISICILFTFSWANCINTQRTPNVFSSDGDVNIHLTHLQEFIAWVETTCAQKYTILAMLAMLAILVLYSHIDDIYCKPFATRDAQTIRNTLYWQCGIIAHNMKIERDRT